MLINQLPTCDWRDWSFVKRGPNRPKKDGSWGPSYQFHGAPACGKPAETTLPDGSHRCLAHLNEERSRLARKAEREAGRIGKLGPPKGGWAI